MKYLAVKCLCLLVFLSVISSVSYAQPILIDHHFDVATLPAEVTSSGTISPTKAADGVCSKGMIQVNSGGYLQVDVSSCGVFTINMKSTSSSARMVTVKYKKDGDVDYTVATTTLSVALASSYDFTTLFPAILTSLPISIRVEPTNGNIQIHDLYVQASATQSTEAEITAFKIPGQLGDEVINSGAGTIAINVPLGTSLTSVVPGSISISSQASINPAKTAPQNFISPVIYTVTAQDGVSTKAWTVTVTAVASSAKEITAFKLSNLQYGNAIINSGAATIDVTMPHNASLSSIIPTVFTLSENATASPLTTSAQDFAGPVQYTVTAQDNSTKIWTVNTKQVNADTVFTPYEAEYASFTGTVDNNHNGFTGTGFVNFLSSDNQIIFSVCQREASTQTAKFRYSLANDTDRKGKLFVNDNYVGMLLFPRTTTFDEWKEESMSVTLAAGINNIKITWDSTDGPNLDKLLLSGAACNSYTLEVTATNGGTVTVSPARADNKYFDTENVTLLANSTPSLQFTNWSGDLTGSANPAVITVPFDKKIVANFTTVPTFKVNVTVNGIGEVELNPAGGEYPLNTIVTATAKPILGSVFNGWTGDLTGTVNPQNITVNSTKNITASFTSNYTFDFDKVIGFAATSGDGFTGPTVGGSCSPDTLRITGPAAFNTLCEALYNRQQAYKKGITVEGMKNAPLVIVLQQGIYDGTQTLSTNGAKVFGNSMLDIPEQGDLTFMGESGATFKIGINVKRSWNVLIRNITFQDYYDDGVNIGGELTHHIWVDHCTFGHPTTRPADSEHPDGGCDIKDGASYVTVSWCIFRNSWKTSLVGHSDNNGATDNGRLKVTYVNNHFLNTNSRNPRVRFGEVHVLNNLAEGVSLYGSVAANQATVLMEGNFFLNTDWPMYADRSVADFKAYYGNNTDNVYTSKTGNYPARALKQINNDYDDAGLPVITAQINPDRLNPGGRSIKFDELNPGLVFDPSTYYTYAALTPAEVRVIVPIYAGADKVAFNASCGTLPVKQLSFDVQLINSTEAKAVWQTSNEVNALNYEVERSANARDFSKLGKVSAKNNIAINDYSFVDHNVLPGLSYYRLKQTDKDGKFSYSKTVVLNNQRNSKFGAYPNPVYKNISMTHAKAEAGATIRIMAADGRLLQLLNVQQGSTVTSADVSQLPPGTYLLILQNGNERASSKFVKQ